MPYPPRSPDLAFSDYLKSKVYSLRPTNSQDLKNCSDSSRNDQESNRKSPR